MKKLKSISLVFLLVLFNIQINVYASSPNLIFPENILKLKYDIVYEYAVDLSDFSYSYEISEVGIYEIVNVDKENNILLINYVDEHSLDGYDGLVPIGIDLDFKNGTTRRVPFSENRGYTYSVLREVDLFDGKVLSIKNEKEIPVNTTFIYRYEDDYEEKQGSIGTGSAEVGYVPFAWVGKYESIDSEIFVRSTRAGTFNCVRKYEEEETEFWNFTYESYYDADSGICVFQKGLGEEGYYPAMFGAELHSLRQNKLELIEYGRKWDNFKVFDSGCSVETSTVGDTEQIWFKISYDFDGVTFDENKGIVYINDVKAEWNSYEERWELEVSSQESGLITYEVTNIDDNWLGVEEIVSEVTNPVIEWKSAGIPSFDHISIIIGIMMIIFLMHRK